MDFPTTLSIMVKLGWYSHATRRYTCGWLYEFHIWRGKSGYSEDLNGSRFYVDNPNASSTCGCGNSSPVRGVDPENRWFFAPVTDGTAPHRLFSRLKASQANAEACKLSAIYAQCSLASKTYPPLSSRSSRERSFHWNSVRPPPQTITLETFGVFFTDVAMVNAVNSNNVFEYPESSSFLADVQ